MASEFVQAILAQSLARRDDETKAATEYIAADTEKLRDEVRVSKADTIRTIASAMREELAEDTQIPAVKQAYEKLLAGI